MFTIARQCTLETKSSPDVVDAYIHVTSIAMSGLTRINQQQYDQKCTVLEQALDGENQADQYIAGVATAWGLTTRHKSVGVRALCNLIDAHQPGLARYVQHLCDIPVEQHKAQTEFKIATLAMVALLVHAIECHPDAVMATHEARTALRSLARACVIPAAAANVMVLPRSVAPDAAEVGALLLAISRGDHRAMFQYMTVCQTRDRSPITSGDLRMIISAIKHSVAWGDITLPIPGSSLGDIQLMIGLRLLTVCNQVARPWLDIAFSSTSSKDAVIICRIRLIDAIMQGHEPIHHNVSVLPQDLQRIDAAARTRAAPTGEVGLTSPIIVSNLLQLQLHARWSGRLCPVALICTRYGIGTRAEPNFARDLAHNAIDDPQYRWCYARWSRDDDHPYVGLARLYENRQALDTEYERAAKRARLGEATARDRVSALDVIPWSSSTLEPTEGGIIAYNGPYAGMTPQEFEAVPRVKDHGLDRCPTHEDQMMCIVCLHRIQAEYVHCDGFISTSQTFGPNSLPYSLMVNGDPEWQPPCVESLARAPSTPSWTGPVSPPNLDDLSPMVIHVQNVSQVL